MKSFNDRQEYNLKILDKLKDFVLDNPDMRFFQMLYALRMYDQDDKFYEESKDTYDNYIKKYTKDKDCYESFPTVREQITEKDPLSGRVIFNIGKYRKAAKENQERLLESIQERRNKIRGK